MTSVPRLLDYLQHMQEATRQILAYTAALDQAAFHADTRTQQAVLFNFVVLGEAATKLMAGHGELLARHPQVPWRSIKDMRNQVAHGYFAIDLDVIWRTVRHALPALLDSLPAVIADAAEQRNRPDVSPTEEGDPHTRTE